MDTTVIEASWLVLICLGDQPDNPITWVTGQSLTRFSSGPNSFQAPPSDLLRDQVQGPEPVRGHPVVALHDPGRHRLHPGGDHPLRASEVPSHRHRVQHHAGGHAGGVSSLNLKND